MPSWQIGTAIAKREQHYSCAKIQISGENGTIATSFGVTASAYVTATTTR
jgi:hypothetical protein